MKKFRFDPAKTTPLIPAQPSKAAPKDNKLSKEEIQKEAMKSKLEKEMAILNEQKAATYSHISETKKLLDIDLFLKKEKEKRLDYSKKLNQEYEHDKKDREKKLYKTTKSQKGSKLMMGAIKSEIPLNIFGAVDQIQKADNQLKKWIFEDHHLKLDEMILDKSKSEYFDEGMRTAQQDCLKQGKDNIWKRAKQITTNCTQIQYFPVKYQENHLQPSDYGEALMSVLTLMPESLSEYLYHQYHNLDIDRQKYFMLRLFAGGQKKTVLTNEWLQTREYAHKMVNVNSRQKTNLVFWSGILEKAFRKLFYKQHQQFTLTQMFNIVYGVDPQIIHFGNKTIIRDNFHKVIRTLIEQKPKAIVGFINDRSHTPHRVYPLLEVIMPAITKKKKKDSQVQKEGPVSATDIQYHISNPYAGSILSSNFVNKFTLNQLFQKFNKIVILRELPSKWSGIRIFVQFLSNGPISFTGSSWTHNNQYSFTLSKTVNIHIALRKRWGSYIDSTQKQQENNYGYMLFRSLNGQTEISCLKLQALVHKAKNTDECGCIFDSTLQKGTYVLIPYSRSVSQQYMQLYNLDIYSERQDFISINKSRMNDYYYQNGESGDKVIQKLQSKVKYQKPKWEYIMPAQLRFSETKNIINTAYIEGLGLRLMNGVSCQEYFLPGRLKRLLADGQVKEEKKEKVVKKSAQNQQIQQYQKEQALRILLGYDVLMGEDIGYGEMKAILQQTQEDVDLAHFGLGEQGLLALLEPLMQLPRIVTLNISHNDLNDSAITYLCYYLQKGNRNELRLLDVKGNAIGRSGQRALKGLAGLFPDLKIEGVKI